MKAIVKVFLAVAIGLVLAWASSGVSAYQQYNGARQTMLKATAAAEICVEQNRRDPQALEIRRQANEAMARYVEAARRWHDVLMAAN